MRIYVLERTPAEGDALCRVIGTGHDIATAGDLARLLDRVRTDAADVVVIDWGTFHRGGVTLAQLRALGAGRLSAIALVHGAVEMASAFAAGFDDVVRRPIARDEIQARVARSLRPPDVPRADGPRGLIRMLAWLELRETVCRSLGEMTGLVFAPVRDADGPIELAGQIVLSHAEEEAEIAIAVGATRETLGAIAARLLGDDCSGDEVALDLLREMTNVCGGGVKRELLDGGGSLTIGLPAIVPARALSDDADPGVSAMDCTLVNADTGIRLRLRIAIGSRGNCEIPVAQLREGMVLGRDLFASSGALLAASGTFLTGATIERLRELMPGPTVIAVAAPPG